MRKRLLIKVFLILSILYIYACSNPKQTIKEDLQNKDLKEFTGKRITIIGQTINMKMGALLITENGENIWMEGLDSWPDGYYVNEHDAKTVKVTGVLIEKNDLPVFIPDEKNSVIQQGIPNPKKSNLKEASRRYLFKDYKYSIIK